MIDIIRKTLLAGVGAAVVTKEKIDAALAEFVREGKVSAGDARVLAEKLAADGKREFETLSNDINETLKEFFARQDKSVQDRIATLEARVTALEVAAAKANPPPTPEPDSPPPPAAV